MASLLSYTDFMASGGLFGASEERIDWSDVLAAVLFENKQLLGMLKWGPPAENIVYNHLEDSLNPPTILGTYTTGANTFVPSTTYSQADVYRILRHSASAGALGITLQVDVADGQGFTIRRTVDTGVPLAGDTNWTVIGGTEAAVSSDAKFYASLPKPDESDASPDTSKGRSVRQGAVRVFERAIEVAETRQHISLIAVPDEVKMQTKYRTLEVVNELAQAIIRERVFVNAGSLNAAISAAAGTHTFPGIIQQLTDPGLDNATGTFSSSGDAPLNVDVAGASMITKALLNARIEAIGNEGGLDAPGYDGAIICNSTQARQIATFDESLRRSDVEYRKAGYTVTRFVSDLGQEYPIIVERLWPSTMVGLLDLSRIEMRGLQGDDWHLEKMAKTGRTDKWQLSGQFGVSVKNIDICQSLIFKLSTS